MNILFTGASSFTGYWFTNILRKNGHKIVATFTKNMITDYDGLKRTRIERMQHKLKLQFGVNFGNSKFLSLLDSEKFDLVCHHGAEVSNYKSFNFDVCSAFKNNTFNILQVLEQLKKKKTKLVITGSLFEGNESIGGKSSLALSPYGLSKQISSLSFEYYSFSLGIPLGKFIIPNPFGPYEEERFTTFLVKSWIKNEKPIII